MQLRTYLLLCLYATAAAAFCAAWLIASNDPTAGHGELIERNQGTQRRNRAAALTSALSPYAGSLLPSAATHHNRTTT